MQVRDRIKELRRVKASELHPSPRNWRRHPAEQQNALRGLLADIGYADALLVREREDGELELIDGHLRAETTPNQTVPVLVLDVSEAEANRILATHDPLAALAQTDQEQLDRLLAEINIDDDAVQKMLADLAADARSASNEPPKEVEVPEAYQVVVECMDEEDQRLVYEQMKAQGYKCRVLTL